MGPEASPRHSRFRHQSRLFEVPNVDDCLASGSTKHQSNSATRVRPVDSFSALPTSNANARRVTQAPARPTQAQHSATAIWRFIKVFANLASIVRSVPTNIDLRTTYKSEDISETYSTYPICTQAPHSSKTRVLFTRSTSHNARHQPALDVLCHLTFWQARRYCACSAKSGRPLHLPRGCDRQSPSRLLLPSRRLVFASASAVAASQASSFIAVASSAAAAAPSANGSPFGGEIGGFPGFGGGAGGFPRVWWQLTGGSPFGGFGAGAGGFPGFGGNATGGSPFGGFAGGFPGLEATPPPPRHSVD